MTTWTSDELRKIETAEELEVASLRGDGTLRKPTPIWIVRVGDALYVRSVNGPTSACQLDALSFGAFRIGQTQTDQRARTRERK